MCSPGLTVDDYFSNAMAWERPVFDKVATHLQSLGDVIIDPIAIGILFKNGPMLCELRAKKKWTALGFFLRRRLTSSRLSRKVVDYQGKYFHVINVDDPDVIDDELLDWLAEAYHVAGGNLEAAERIADPSNDGQPMVPDDVEDPFG